MAKWGEGDPRWIVEERPDATNVNNWHWLEKNANQWSQDLLRKLLVGVKVDDPSIGVIEITELESIEGEAAAYNRKAKLIFFYEWVIKGCWEGHLNGKEDKIKGKFEVPNVSEENSADEVDVNVTIDESSIEVKGADALKELARTKGSEVIKLKIGEYVTKLKNDFAKDLIKPTKDQVQNSSSAATTGNLVKETSSKLHINNKVSTSKSTTKTQSSTSGLEVKDLTLTEELKCKSEEIFRVFVTSELLSAFSRGQASVDPVVGGTFTMYDGNISGTFTKIEPNELIEQSWRFKQWPEGYYSKVNITFEEKEDHTLVTLKQTGIPANDYDRTENGWKINYFKSIKQTFGFGALLY